MMKVEEEVQTKEKSELKESILVNVQMMIVVVVVVVVDAAVLDHREGHLDRYDVNIVDS
jgi:hypothetical protein